MLLTAYNQHSVDFDFYPDVHRRSLKLSGSIGGPIRQTHFNEDTRLCKDTGFVCHLFETHRLYLEHLQRVRPRDSEDKKGEPILLNPEVPALLVEW